MSVYDVKCLEAKYDPEIQKAVLYCVFLYSGERKIVIFERDDLAQLLQSAIYGLGSARPAPIEISDKEIYLFIEGLSNRTSSFKMSIEDDPNTKKMTPQEEIEYASMFKKSIGEELTKVCDGLVDETGKMKRRLGDLLDKGDIDIMKLIKEEKTIRGKIG